MHWLWGRPDAMDNISNLPTYDEDGALRAVIETPRGSRVKIDFNPALGTFEMARPLVLGLTYPYDWGFFPSTLAEDGDPLDVMVVHDAGTFPGVTILVRVAGVIEVSQKSESGKGRERNDRILAAPTCDHRFKDARDLNKRERRELEEFFITAVAMTRKGVRIEGWAGPHKALGLIEEAQRRYARSSTKRK